VITVGLDIGSTTTKAVVLDDRGVAAAVIEATGVRPAETAAAVLQQAMTAAHVTPAEVSGIACTGYGRRLAGFGDLVLTEIKACALGATATLTTAGPVRTVIDVGGQDTKVLALSDDGEVEDFSMNDKCAAGTGRFLEMLAQKLDLPYEEFVAAALRSKARLQMNATCAVFAESEVVGMLARDVPKADIAAAAHQAIAARIGAMVRRVGRRGPYGFVGGGARNQALVQALIDHLGHGVEVLDQPQCVVALGAALGARRRLARLSPNGASESAVQRSARA